jgi:integrase/recombinase XerD
MKYLFEGQIKGQPYDARSLQLILKQALKKAGITKPATCIGCDTAYDNRLRFIQELLGHSSSKTEIYT